MQKVFHTVLFLLIGAGSVSAQNMRGPRGVSYTSLVNRASAPVFFFDEVILPGKTDSTLSLNFIFRMNNDFLTFKKINVVTDPNLPREFEFYSTARLNSEVFEGEGTGKNAKFTHSVARDVWQDTVYTASFEDTDSKKIHTAGFLTTELAPGRYEYLLQLNILDDNKDRNSTRSRIDLTAFASKKTGEIIPLKAADTPSVREEFPLLNLGNNVIYGEDYSVLVRLPDFSSAETYKLEVAKAVISRSDTTASEIVYQAEIPAEFIYENVKPVITNAKNPAILLQPSEKGFAYAVVKIPNHRFQNSVYEVAVKRAGTDAPAAKRILRSYWPDMPPALLSLDISIELLKFILPEQEVKNMLKGSNTEKEKRFREFWSSKDPTPDTEYNELMTEYYRRVDYAFKEFRNVENPDGHETDRGKIYIQYGPPQSTDRSFPSKGQVVETWKYAGQTFVFEKGTGFSDFKLVARN